MIAILNFDERSKFAENCQLTFSCQNSLPLFSLNFWISDQEELFAFVLLEHQTFGFPIRGKSLSLQLSKWNMLLRSSILCLQLSEKMIKVYPLFADSKIVRCQRACKGSKISAFPVIYRVIGLSPIFYWTVASVRNDLALLSDNFCPCIISLIPPPPWLGRKNVTLNRSRNDQ